MSFFRFLVIGVVTLFSPSCASSPDLTAGPASPTTTTVNKLVTFSAPISNIGNAGTSRSFAYFFQVGITPAEEGTIKDFGFVTIPQVDAGETVIAIFPYVFTSPGVRIVRVCADKKDRNSVTPTSGAVVSESNEDNNCGPWVNVIVNSL